MQVRKKKGEKGGGANLYTKRVQIEVRKEKNERERKWCKIGKGARERFVQI